MRNIRKSIFLLSVLSGCLLNTSYARVLVVSNLTKSPITIKSYLDHSLNKSIDPKSTSSIDFNNHDTYALVVNGLTWGFATNYTEYDLVSPQGVYSNLSSVDINWTASSDDGSTDYNIERETFSTSDASFENLTNIGNRTSINCYENLWSSPTVCKMLINSGSIDDNNVITVVFR